MSYPAFPDMHGAMTTGIQRGYLDPGLSTPFENGMAQSRARFPRVRRSFVVPFRYVSAADAIALDTFVRETVVGSAGIFTWTDPRSGEVINVRFPVGKCPQINEAGFVARDITESFNIELEEV